VSNSHNVFAGKNLKERDNFRDPGKDGGLLKYNTCLAVTVSEYMDWIHLAQDKESDSSHEQSKESSASIKCGTFFLWKKSVVKEDSYHTENVYVREYGVLYVHLISLISRRMNKQSCPVRKP
jgi:hypothetical protein